MKCGDLEFGGGDVTSMLSHSSLWKQVLGKQHKEVVLTFGKPVFGCHSDSVLLINSPHRNSKQVAGHGGTCL